MRDRAPSQLAGGLVDPIEGPSSHTLDELKALKIFADTDSPSLPHLISWKTAVQGADGPMPGGYIAYVVMTRMPGLDLLELKFWSMPEDLQEEIRKNFLVAIKCVINECVLYRLLMLTDFADTSGGSASSLMTVLYGISCGSLTPERCMLSCLRKLQSGY